MSMLMIIIRNINAADCKRRR